MSPDLNPIEHVWDMFDRRVRKRPAAPLTALFNKSWLMHLSKNGKIFRRRTYTSLELDGAASLELVHAARF
jgi:transposase